MASLNGFNAAEVEPHAGFDPIPSGKYMLAVVNSELKPTAAGTGEFIELEINVIDGEYKGRKIWHRINWANPNQQAVKIGRAEMSALCRACNKLDAKDTIELHDIPFCGTVGIEKRKDNGEPANVIKKCEPRAAMQSQAKPATVGEKPPWMK